MTSVIDERRQDLAAFCEANGIEYLGVFGSYARGDFDESSDIDLLVRFNKRIGLIRFVRIELDLERLLGRNVDLVTERGLSQLIRDNVHKEVRAIYGQR